MGIAYNPQIIMNDLVLSLDAANPKSYSGSGTSVFNVVGNNNHTLVGASYVLLSGIKCFDCSSGGYILPVTANQLLPTSGYTYIAWARMKSSNVEWRTLFRTTADDHPILVAIGGVSLGMFDNNSTGFNSSGYDTTSIYDTWCQWVVTGSVFTGSTFYINDTQAGSTVPQSAAGNFHNVIGGAGGGQSFGHVATTMLYNRILSIDEIKQNYNATRRRYSV